MERMRLAVRGLGLAALAVLLVFVEVAVFAGFVALCPSAVAESAAAVPAISSGSGRTSVT